MTSVLFVCTGNMYRSPIAAEIFRGLLLQDPKRNNWQVSSAGTWTIAGRPAPDETIKIAQSLGINLRSHLTRMVNQQIMLENDLIIVMEEGHKEALQAEFPFAKNKVHLLSYALQGVNYDIADPAAMRTDTRIILQELASLIRAGYENLCKLAN